MIATHCRHTQSQGQTAPCLPPTYSAASATTPSPAAPPRISGSDRPATTLRRQRPAAWRRWKRHAHRRRRRRSDVREAGDDRMIWNPDDDNDLMRVATARTPPRAVAATAPRPYLDRQPRVRFD